MSTKATALFAVQAWEESPYFESEGEPKLTRAQVKKTFTGDIEGEGEVEYLMTHRPDGTAVFIGQERIVGKLGGKQGSFILQHDGTFEAGVAKGRCVVVHGSGTGGLQGLRGEGIYEALGREAPFDLDYEFE